MATLCRNCGNPLHFDPERGGVVCDACGSAFAAEQVESYGKAYQEGASPMSVDPVTGQPAADPAVREFFDCHVYTCSSCGGEIFINGSEVSTTCIYCGSPSVIFSRISKELRPDFILPFQISKEQAAQIMRQKFGSGMFVPDEFKNFQVDAIRGIYIPFWLVDVYHAESDIISGQVDHGDSSSTYHYARAGRMKMSNLLVEASTELNDSSSMQLLPYDLRKLRNFDEEYLLGFYSDASDITFGELRRVADVRVTSIYRQKVYKDIHAYGCSVEQGQSATLIDKDLKYALLPVWFLTLQFDGKPNTILVNGETGKIVGGLPWNKKKFWSRTALVGSIFGVLNAIVFSIIGLLLASGFGKFGTWTVITAMFPVLGPCLFVGGVLWLIGIFFYLKVKRQLDLTQSEATFNFAKKRQG